MGARRVALLILASERWRTAGACRKDYTGNVTRFVPARGCANGLEAGRLFMGEKVVQVRHVFVEGYVQGVGYRAFVCRWAQRLGVSGWVRNRTNGEVEA